MRIAFSAAALLLAGCSTVPATETVSSATAPSAQFVAAPLPRDVTSDLPRTARPLHYAISFTPNLDALTFTGRETIELEVYELTDALVLNANGLEISRAILTPASGGNALPLTVTLDQPNQAASFAAPDPIVPGTYLLETEYAGTIHTQANGLFALDYPDKRTGKDVRGLFTQFEAPDARRFAPMFDEPSYKATFDLTARVPEDLMAVSNMPVADEETMGDGTKTVRFETSPKMSSYLLFFGLGDFERMTTRTKGGTEIGIVSPAGSGEQARYALDATVPIVEYYNDYFGVPYPLPKLDNIAGPGQSQFFGAMENWGAIFTFEKNLLVDPTITSPGQLNYTYTALAHELAHQWFGDIVTMAWWDDLWLNEGFASWMETKASAKFRPDWYPLLGRVGAREAAMGYDAFETTHPIVQKIDTVAETDQAFDSISYSKGEAVLAMLEAYAGEDTWREGIRAYIRQHAYGNTTSDDLWRAVEQAGAKNLVGIAHDFTLQPGIPLVSASAQCTGGETVLSLTQSEFSRDRKDAVAAQPQSWHVPLLVRAANGETRRTVLDGKTTMRLPGCSAVVVNGGQLGYYRTLYTPEMVDALIAAIPQLDPMDQYGLMRDTYAVSEAGYQPLDPALEMLAAIPVDANPVVAGAAIGRWNVLYGLADEEGRAQIAQLVHDLWMPRLQQLGFDPRKDESLVETDLRSDLITILGNMGDPTVAEEARKRFAALERDPTALDGPLKTTWLGIIARNATAAEWARLESMTQTAPTATERLAFYSLLGAAEDETLARKALALALSGKPGTASAAIISRVAGEHPDLAFDFALENASAVEKLVDSSSWASYVARLGGGSRDEAMIGKLERLGAEAPATQQRSIERAIVRIRERLATEPRLAQQIDAWLGRRG